MGVTQTFQYFHRLGASHSTLAMQQQHLILVLQGKRRSGLDLLKWNVHRVRQMARTEFSGTAHVNHQGSAFEMRLRILR